VDTSIRIPLDDETLRRLRELALAERRATADQASIILARAMRRRQPRYPKRQADER
jgi:hypothetical protein